MRRAPRTRFAASFVAVIAGAGCAHEGASGNGSGTVGSGSGSASGSAVPVSTWSVRKGNDGATCWAMPIIDCSKAPAGATCNPPASTQVACLDPMPAEGSYTILTYDGTHCFLADGKTATTCPGADVPPPGPADAAPIAFVPRRWNISAGEGKTCWAEPEVSCDPAVVHHTCNPPAATKVTCPPYNAGNHVDETAPDKCQMLLVMGGGNCPPKMHCNPPPPREVDVPCPTP